MDKYNQKWVCILGGGKTKEWAVTIGQTAYYSVSEAIVKEDIPWQVHENTHKEQWAREGRIKFLIKYLYCLITKGYINNPYEVEAREAAAKIVEHKKPEDSNLITQKGSMKKLFILLLAVLVVTPTFAADKKLDSKRIRKLQKECGKSANEYVKKCELCEGEKSSRKNIYHYGVKFNSCFVLRKASCKGNEDFDDKYWAEALINLSDENTEVASYIGSGKLNDEPSICNVDETVCHSLSEFYELVKPYMGE